jgi:hypothetical protein
MRLTGVRDPDGGERNEHEDRDDEEGEKRLTES